MKSKPVLTTLFAVVSMSAFFCPQVHAIGSDQPDQIKETNDQQTVPAEHFIELLKSDLDLDSKYVFSCNGEYAQAMEHLEFLRKRFQQTGGQVAVETKVVGDFSLSIIKFGSQTESLMMFRDDYGWKYISESDFDADSSRQMFDRRQLGAMWVLMLWGQENGL